MNSAHRRIRDGPTRCRATGWTSRSPRAGVSSAAAMSAGRGGEGLGKQRLRAVLAEPQQFLRGGNERGDAGVGQAREHRGERARPTARPSIAARHRWGMRPAFAGGAVENSRARARAVGMPATSSARCRPMLSAASRTRVSTAAPTRGRTVRQSGATPLHRRRSRGAPRAAAQSDACAGNAARRRNGAASRDHAPRPHARGLPARIECA